MVIGLSAKFEQRFSKELSTNFKAANLGRVERIGAFGDQI